MSRCASLRAFISVSGDTSELVSLIAWRFPVPAARLLTVAAMVMLPVLDWRERSSLCWQAGFVAPVYSPSRPGFAGREQWS